MCGIDFGDEKRLRPRFAPAEGGGVNYEVRGCLRQVAGFPTLGAASSALPSSGIHCQCSRKASSLQFIKSKAAVDNSFAVGKVLRAWDVALNP